MNQPHHSHVRRAFTLIELLTVIAIIGILAAIIIPVVGVVRQQARVTQSLSNLRQIGLGQQLYANANKDYFAPGQMTSPLVYWVDYLDAYIDSDLPQFQRIRIYTDPTALPGTSAAPPTTAYMHYSMNQAASGSSYDSVTQVRTSAIVGRSVPTRSSIARPSQTMLVVTGTQEPTNGSAAASLYNGINFNSTNLNALVPSALADMSAIGGIAYRLRDSAGAAMVDGSVRSFKKGTVTYANLLPW